MGRLSLAILTITLGLATAQAAEIAHFEHLTDLRAASARGTGGVAATLLLEFAAFGRVFQLELEPNARLHVLHARLGLPIDTVAYRGTLVDQPNSWVRLVKSPQGMAGLISDGESQFGIEAPFDSGIARDETIIYRLEDLYFEPGSLACGTQASALTATAMLAHIEADTVATLAQEGAAFNLNIGAVADFEFTQAFGADAETAMLARFNTVDGIFSAQLGVQITVAETDLFTAEPDPFTATDGQALLDELAIYRGNTAAQDAQGLTHLFTGRDLDGSTAGMAYVGALCAQRSAFDPEGRSYGAGLSEGNRGLIVDSLVAAHEIGHNFGAPHDAEAGSACESTASTYLMASTLNGSNQFSQCSIGQIQPEIAAADCLMPIGQPDILVTGPAVSPEVGIGEPFAYAIRVANEGLDAASGVAVSIELGGGLAWNAASAAPASCERSGQTIRCNLDSLNGGAEASFVLTLIATAEGGWPLTAIASADVDVNPANDTWRDTITARPFIDLTLGGAGAAIQVGGMRAVALDLVNLAAVSATDIALALDASTGLRIDDVSLGGGSCTVTGQTATCSLAMLASGSATVLSLALTALTAGTQTVVATASSLEPDQNTADNRLALTFDVRAPRPAGSGGGSAATLLLALVAGLGVRAFRQRRGDCARWHDP